MAARINNYSKVSTQTEVPGLGIGSAIIIYNKRGTTTTVFGGALYGFAIYQTILGGVLAPLPIKEFFFPVSPKSIDLDEPNAVNIQYTQGGGRWIEHQGSILKTLNISGTTGFRPMQGIIPYVPDGILPVPTPNYSPSTFLASPEVLGRQTGMQHFLQLRNVFRQYADLKSGDLTSQRHVMVWFNMKEGEYFVVEPLNFSLKRDSSSPFTFNYQISCQVIDFADGMGLIPTRDFIAWRALVSSTNPLQLISDILDFGDSLIDDFKVSGEIMAIYFATTANTFTKRVATVQTAFNDYKSTGKIDSSVLNVSSSKGMIADLDAIRAKLSVSATDSSDLYFRAMSSITKAYRYAAQLNAIALDVLPSLKSSTSVNSHYKQPGGNSTSYTKGDYPAMNSDSNATALSPGFVNFIPDSFTYDRVQEGEDIYRLAIRLMGDVSYWKILVKANKLESPYVSSDPETMINVLGTGALIKVPQFGGSARDVGNTIVTDPLNEQSRDSDNGLRSLGTDIGVVFTSNGVDTVIDMATTRSGDLETTSGMDNMRQALNMKLTIERGTLPLHPEYGLLKVIGSKGTISLAVRQSIAFKSTMLSDRRVDSVDRVEVTINGDVVRTKGNVKLKAVEVPVGVSLATST